MGDHGLERLLLVTARLVFELSQLCRVDQILTLLIGFLDKCIFLGCENRPGGNVVDTEGEPIVGYVYKSADTRRLAVNGRAVPRYRAHNLATRFMAAAASCGP
jgi:hypothetical protein